ncbi:ribonuclease HII [Bacillus benzoevorans]|uniref:ribonuclease HII n=1 Tax=Bacillus benzoevorans TaxID=1456 RepID=UPI00160A924F
MLKWTVKEIEEKLETIHHQDDPLYQQFAADERKGVQKALKRWIHKQEEMNKKHERFMDMTVYEQKYHNQGFKLIAGIDEVGRGPLAGPVVAAAVILPEDFYLPGIDDSKKLSENLRERFFLEIQEKAEAIGIGIIDNDEIDKINIFEAAKKAMLEAIQQLEPKPDFLLIDAVKLHTPYPFDAIIKGDSLSVSIAAASIIAKVTRDRMMKDYEKRYPQYGFARNAGYGTKEHLESIAAHGITPIHRKTFAPVKDYIGS